MLKNFRKIMIIIVRLLMPIFITGCWNNIDVNDRVFVVAAGLDKSKNGQIDFTVQVIKPSAIGSRKQGGSIKATENISSQGITVFDAVRNMLTRNNKKPFYGHIQVIIIGEDFARQGIANALDWFARDTEPDKRCLVLIARGTTARRVLQVEGALEDIPAVEITNTLKNNNALPKMKECQLNEVIKSLNSKGKNPLVGVVSAPQKQQQSSVSDLDFTGTAVFKKDKLVGWLSPEETTGYLFTQNKVKSGIINIANPVDAQGKIAIEILRSKGKLDVRFRNGEPVLYIKIKEEGNIGEQEGKGELTSFSQVQKLEKETAQVIKNYIMKAIIRTQNEYQVDIFGFGDIVHRRNLSYWKTVENNWNEVFSTLTVEIEVESKIRRAGLIKKQAGEAK
jgi:spore germination protein KC